MQSVTDVLKEKYGYEIERKRYYDNVITLPVSLIAFIITGVYFIVTEHNCLLWFNNIKPILVYDLLASSIISMFFLYRVFFGMKRRYCSFPESNVVLADLERIKESHQSISDEKKRESLIEADFNDFIIYWYKEANDENIIVNDLRADNFHLAKFFIGISYLLGIVMFILYCYTKFN